MGLGARRAPQRARLRARQRPGRHHRRHDPGDRATAWGRGLMTNGSAGLRVFALAGRDVPRVRFASPWLTWGAVAGTKAGELLQVEYSVNRPLLARATIKLADG